MMFVSEKIERLIVRQLDGELTGDERLILDCELRRSVEARKLLASYEKVDALAVEVIFRSTGLHGAGLHSTGDCVADAPVLIAPDSRVTSAPTAPPRPSAPTPQRSSGWWMYPVAALAACLALVLIWKTPAHVPTQRVADETNVANTPQALRSPGLEVPVQMTRTRTPIGSEVGVWQVGSRPAVRRDRFTDRNLIVVPDREGNLYLINVDHVREIDQPRGKPRIPYTRNPI